MISLLKHEPRPKDIDEEASNNLENNPKHFFVHWKALLGMLLRTAPYLDEHKAGMPSVDSTSRKSSVMKKTANLIRQCRRYFNQDLVQIAGNFSTDKTSCEVWNMV